jgi:hypothetical protein
VFSGSGNREQERNTKMKRWLQVACAAVVLVAVGMLATCDAMAEESQAGSNGGTGTKKSEATSHMCFISWLHVDAFYRLEGQEQEFKMPGGGGNPYGRYFAEMLPPPHVYKVRFEPDYSKFAAFGDRILKVGVWDGTPAGWPGVIVALPVPSTPFYFNDGYLPPSFRYPQVHSMAELNAATTTVWFLKPAEKGATGPYANSNLYVKTSSHIRLVLEDSTITPTNSIIAPKEGETVSGTYTVGADIGDEVGVPGVSFRVDGVEKAMATDVKAARPDYRGPYKAFLDTTKLTDGPHEIVAVAPLIRGFQCFAESKKVKFIVNNASPTPKGAER